MLTGHLHEMTTLPSKEAKNESSLKSQTLILIVHVSLISPWPSRGHFSPLWPGRCLSQCLQVRK